MSGTILLTGAGPKGVTGRLIKDRLQSKYTLLTPSSKELDLTNDGAVSEYFNLNKIDYVIHCATFRPASTDSSHLVDEELESNLRMYFALAAQSSKFKKMIYFGSGAEFDKSKPIVGVSENDFGHLIPKNKYGLGKYIMNCHTLKSDNIYNFRLFGTVNKYERYTKNVVSNLCVKAILGLPIELRQDCRFSFFDINDVISVIERALDQPLKYHDYNLVMDDSYLLSEIAEMILKLAKSNDKISFAKEGLNLEYTASNLRMKGEFHPNITSMEAAVENVYRHYLEVKDSLDASEIDSRWKK